MIELGKRQALKIMRFTQNGAYLNVQSDDSERDILLPQNQVPHGAAAGDEIEVFVYKDSEDRIIATVHTPKLTIGTLAVLKVVKTTDIGAFLDWGLEKDLLLPFSEQACDVAEGGEYLVALYVDKSNRLCATMKVYDQLSSHSPYKEKEWVRGIIYNYNSDFGYFVAVDQKYHGLIANKEVFANCKVGDHIRARIKKVRADGKLELSLRDSAYKEIEGDAQKILERMNANHGRLPINDNSAPEKIKSQLNMSKGAFKRAVGRLLKEGTIKTTQEGIEIIAPPAAGKNK